MPVKTQYLELHPLSFTRISHTTPVAPDPAADAKKRQSLKPSPLTRIDSFKETPPPTSSIKDNADVVLSKSSYRPSSAFVIYVFQIVRFQILIQTALVWLTGALTLHTPRPKMRSRWSILRHRHRPPPCPMHPALSLCRQPHPRACIRPSRPPSTTPWSQARQSTAPVTAQTSQDTARRPPHPCRQTRNVRDCRRLSSGLLSRPIARHVRQRKSKVPTTRWYRSSTSCLVKLSRATASSRSRIAAVRCQVI